MNKPRSSPRPSPYCSLAAMNPSSAYLVFFFFSTLNYELSKVVKKPIRILTLIAAVFDSFQESMRTRCLMTGIDDLFNVETLNCNMSVSVWPL